MDRRRRIRWMAIGLGVLAIVVMLAAMRFWITALGG